MYKSAWDRKGPHRLEPSKDREVVVTGAHFIRQKLYSEITNGAGRSRTEMGTDMPSSYHAPPDDRARLEQAVNGLLLLNVLARKAAGVIDQPQKYELILPEGISVADEAREALEEVLDALAWVLLFEQHHRVTLAVPGLQLQVPTVGEGDGTNRALDVVPVTVTSRDDHAGGRAALHFVVGGRRRQRVVAHCVPSAALWMVSGYAAYEDPDTTRDDSPER